MVRFSVGMMPIPMLVVAIRGSVAPNLVAWKRGENVGEMPVNVTSPSFTYGVNLRAVVDAYAQLIGGLEEDTGVEAQLGVGFAVQLHVAERVGKGTSRCRFTEP